METGHGVSTDTESRKGIGVSQLTLSNEVISVGIGPLNLFKGIESGVGALVAGGAVGDGGDLETHSAKQATLFTDLLGESTGVNSVHGGNALLLEPGAERGLGEEVGVVLAAVGGDDETSNMDLRRLEVSGQIAKELVDGLA